MAKTDSQTLPATDEAELRAQIETLTRRNIELTRPDRLARSARAIATDTGMAEAGALALLTECVGYVNDRKRADDAEARLTATRNAVEACAADIQSRAHQWPTSEIAKNIRKALNAVQ